MSNIFVKIEHGAEDAAKAIGHFFQDVATADKALHALTPELRKDAANLFADFLAAVAAIGGAVEAKGLNLAVDSTAYAAIVKFYDDAKADVPEAKAVLSAFGVKVQ